MSTDKRTMGVSSEMGWRRRRLGEPCAASLVLLGWASMACSLMTPAKASAQLAAPYSERVTVEEFASAASPTDIAFAGDGRALIVRKFGEITVVHTDGATSEITGTFSNVNQHDEQGLLGIVAHPSEANTFFFYVSDGTTAADRHRVYRGELAADADELSVDLENPIVGAARGVGPGLEGPANHNGGGLIIYDNQLYIGVGDTGFNARVPNNKYGSCLNKPNGKILRVNLDGSIPEDNPLVGLTSVTSCDTPRGAFGMAAPDERIYAWGFRNPFRLWVDSETDLLWVGDVGEQLSEEISIGGPDEHYGYPFVEGSVNHVPNQALGMNCDDGLVPARPCTPAVYAYDHDLGRSVTGGLIPEGCGWLNVFDGESVYLFADYGADWVHGLVASEDRAGVTNAENPLVFGDLTNPVSFRMGPDGSLYVVSYANAGGVLRLTPNDQSGDDCGVDPDPGAGGDGGEPATGGAPNPAGGAPAEGGAGGAGGAAANPGAPTTAAEDGGCGCRAAGSPSGSTHGVALSVLLALSLIRRRRSVHSPA